jgi:fructosamine-3-kinase
MESLSKNKLSNQQIDTLTKSAFGKAAAEITENNIGEFSALYIVKMADKEAVLKIAPPENVNVLRYEKNAMQAEVEALKIVKANTNLPIPQVLCYDNSKSLFDSEYFFMEKMRGIDLNSITKDLSETQNKNLMFETGKINRKINEIESEKFGYLAQPDKKSQDWKTVFTNMISDLLDDSRDAGIELPVAYQEIDDIMASFAYACSDVKTPKLVHWDLWQGNILVHDGQISAIIDFERALYADVLMEYFFRKHAINQDFFAGYGIDFSVLDKNARIRLALYDLYLALIWNIEYYYRKFEISQFEWRTRELVAAVKAFANL